MKKKQFNFDEGEYGGDLIESEVKYRGKDYVLVEATEAQIAKYRKRSKFGAIKTRRGTEEIANDPEHADSYLLSMCLFAAAEDGKRKEVREEIIRNWPRRVVAPLVDQLTEWSNGHIPETMEDVRYKLEVYKEKLARMKRQQEDGAEEDEDDPSKNSQAGSTATS
jgi:hypothetical protein